MVCRDWKSGLLLFTILLVIQLAYASTKAYSQNEPSGLWVRSTGETVSMKCPSLDKYSDRALKMPAGCVVQKSGVLLSVERFAELKATASGLQASLDGTKALLEKTRTELNDDRIEFASYLRRTENKLDLIGEDLNASTFHWYSAGVGLAVGASMCGGFMIGGSL